MPYKKRTAPSKFKKRTYKKKYARKYKRKGNFNVNLSKDVFWFKQASDISSAPGSGTIFTRTVPNAVFPIPAFVNQCRMYEQYKVLKVIVKYIAAYVGSETETGGVPAFQRGNVVTYIDQPPLDAQPVSGGITNLMGYPSSKLHQTRATIKRWMSRPSGGRYADWAYITHPGTAPYTPVIAPDTWISEIRIFGDGFSAPPGVANKPFYFTETMYKVIFRSRYRGP